MDNTIAYKNFDKKLFREDYEDIFDFFPEMIEIAQENGDRLYYLYTDAIKCTMLKIVNGETNASLLKKYLKLAMQGMYGHVKSLLNFGQPVELFVGDKKVTLVNESKSDNYIIYIRTILIYANMVRCKPLIDMCLSIDKKSVFYYHPNQKLFIEEYNMIKKGYPKKAYEAYILKFIRHQSGSGSLEFRDNIVIPSKELEKELLFGTQSKFNEKLKVTLDINRSYHDSLDDNRYMDIDEMLPWYIISYACRAYDKGWKITVEDPRLPMFLVNGECNIDSLEFTAEEWNVD